MKNYLGVFQVLRLGGAYGGKINRCTMVSTACAVAANKVRRPVRIIMSLQDNMEMVGKRNPYLFSYTV